MPHQLSILCMICFNFDTTLGKIGKKELFIRNKGSSLLGGGGGGGLVTQKNIVDSGSNFKQEDNFINKDNLKFGCVSCSSLVY